MEPVHPPDPTLLSPSNLALQASMKTELFIQVKEDVRFPLEEDSFCDIISNRACFVDKTLMIKRVIEHEHKTLIISRPRKWEKR